MVKPVQTRTTARKVKDKWKAKRWYRIIAPEMFNNIQVGETLAEEPEKLIGRVVETTVQDLTGDFARIHIKLKFKVTEIKDLDAHTQFAGHDLTSDYIRRLTRRKRSKIDSSFEALTKDNFIIRVKPMVVAEKRIQSSQQSVIRSAMGKAIQESAASKMLSEFVKDIISGELSKNIANACKPIYPLKKIEIRKSEIIETKPPEAQPQILETEESKEKRTKELTAEQKESANEIPQPLTPAEEELLKEETPDPTEKA